MPKDDLSSIFAEDAQEISAPDQDELSKISKLAYDLIELNNKVSEAEDALKEAKRKRDQIATVALPDAMDEVNLAEFKTKDGRKIEIKSGFHPALVNKNKPAAFAWLRKNGHGAIIKNQFSIKFGADQEKDAKKFAQVLKKNGVSYSQKEDIHASTLKAFVNEQMTATVNPDDLPKGHTPFPQNLFGVYPYKIAKIK